MLGHNGAGKTTLISMITGLILPTSGDVKFKNYSLSKNLNEIRKILGVCPQHNILYPELTAIEHLYLYAVFKRVPKDKINAEIEEIIGKFGLTAQANEKSENMSGGEKRKLCIGIALIGTSEIVILDEPTSGLDVTARRNL